LDTRISREVLRACDVALIPVLPSPIDLWASLRLPQEVAEARKANPRLKAYLLINQLEPKNALSGAMFVAMAEFGLPILKSCVRRRAVYRNAALEGVSVYQMGSRGLQAAKEIDLIINEAIAT
jgi:chromosome partitioning protein